MAKKTVEERLKVMEDIDAVSYVMWQYLTAADGGWAKKLSHDADTVSALFVEDGTWEAEGYIAVKGRKNIHKAFQYMRKAVPIALHITANPLVQVKGDTAVGHWAVLVLHADDKGNDNFTACKYRNEFVRTPKGWKLKKMFATRLMDGPYADGWTRLVNNLKTVAKPAAKAKARRKNTKKKAR